MLDTLDSPAGWAAANGQTTINAADTITRAQGAASFSMECTAAATDGANARRWLLPQDLPLIQQCAGSPQQVSFFHLMGASVTDVLVRFIYELDGAALATRYEDYAVPVVNAGSLIVGGMFLNVFDYDNPTNRVGIVDENDPVRRKLVALELQAATPVVESDIRFDAIRITPKPKASGAFNPCAVASLAFGIDRLLLPTLLPWLRNPARATTVQASPLKSKVVQRAVWEAINASRDKLANGTLRESLRRFSAYAQGRNNWSLARAADELVDTTVSVLSGVGGSTPDPRRVDLVDTTEVERLVAQASAVRPVRLRVGPNAPRQVETGEVQLVVPGSHVILKEPLTYTHEVGSYVRSEDYYPRCALSRTGDPVAMSGESFTLNIRAREVV